MAPPASPEIVFGVCFSGCAVFAATLPLAAGRAVPAIVRGGLALALTPLVVASTPSFAASDGVARAAINMVFGAVAGLSVSVIAGAATAAGGLLDSAIGSPPAGLDRVFGQSWGPFSTLVPLAFAVALCSSGSLTALIVAFAVSCGAAVPHVTLAGISALGRIVFATALALALPALSSHAIATMIAGCTARIVPRINGMLLAPALGFGLALVAVAAGLSPLLAMLVRIARLSAHVLQTP